MFRKLLIHGIGAHAIGVALNGESKVRVGKNDPGYFSELLARYRAKRGFAGVKQHVRQANDETTGGIASGENDVELLQQFSAQFFAIQQCLFKLLIRGCSSEPVSIRFRLCVSLALLSIGGGLISAGSGGAIPT